jgi:zinc protease
MNRIACLLSMVCIASCVSTNVVEGGPDPRAALAPLSSSTATPSTSNSASTSTSTSTSGSASPATSTPASTTTTAISTTPTTQGATVFARAPILLPSTTDPLVVVRVVFAAGSSDDPQGQAGATQLLARWMLEATQRLSGEELRNTLMPMAAELGVNIDKDNIAFVGRVHRDHAAAFLAIIGDVITAPRLEPADFARLRTSQIADIETGLRSNSDEDLQRVALELALYDDALWANNNNNNNNNRDTAVKHPYAHATDGTVAGLTSLTPAQLAAHRLQVLTRDRLSIGFAGGFQQADVDALISRLSTLPATGAVRASLPTASMPAANRLLVIEKPSAGTALSLGFVLPQLNRDHPDYVAMKLAETWWGEHRNLVGHLFHSMREVRGLNYGNYAYMEYFEEAPGTTFDEFHNTRRQQYFSMWVRPVEHINRNFALKMAMWELQRFVRDGIPSDEELQKVKSFVQGYWLSKEQEPTRRLGYALDAAMSEQTVPHAALAAAAAQLTRAQVNEAIARHLRSSGVTMVAVTDNAKAMTERLVGAQSTPMRMATPPSAAVRAENNDIERLDLGLTNTNIVVVKPAALMQN